MNTNKVFSIFNFKSQSTSASVESCSNADLQEGLRNKSMYETDPDDPPVLRDEQKVSSEITDLGDINTGPIRPKLQVYY